MSVQELQKKEDLFKKWQSHHTLCVFFANLNYFIHYEYSFKPVFSCTLIINKASKHPKIKASNYVHLCFENVTFILNSVNNKIQSCGFNIWGEKWQPPKLDFMNRKMNDNDFTIHTGIPWFSLSMWGHKNKTAEAKTA